MPFNGSGVFTRSMSWVSDAVAGIKIRADRHDLEDDGFAGGLSQCICRDGQSVITGNIAFNGKRIINLGNPVADQDAVTLAYLTKQPLTIAGNDGQGKLTFTGTESDPTAGLPLGLSFAQADLFFGVRKASSPPGIDGSVKNRWVWNDNATGTGNTVMRLDETGYLDVVQIGSIGGSTSATGMTIYAASTLTQGDAFKAPIVALRSGGYGAAASRNAVEIFTGGATGGTAAMGVCAQFFADKTLTVQGNITSAAGNFTAGGSYFVSGTANAILCTTGAGVVYFRPNGAASTTGQGYIDGSGHFVAAGNVYSSAGIFSAVTGATSVVLAAQGQGVFLRPNGPASSVGQCYVDTAGNFNAYSGLYAAGIVQANGSDVRIIADSGSDGYLSFYTYGGGAVQGRLISVDAGSKLTLWHYTGHVFESHNNGNIQITGNTATKVGGGTWASSSDARIKNVTGPYDHGLAQVLALNPVRYTLKGNDTLEAAEGSVPYDNSPNRQAAIDGLSLVGFVAQDIEATMPGMVKQGAGYIDGNPVSDLRTVDVSNLTYALVNAIHELDARIKTLEAA